MTIKYHKPAGSTVVQVVSSSLMPNGSWMCKLACGHQKICSGAGNGAAPATTPCTMCNTMAEAESSRR